MSGIQTKITRMAKKWDINLWCEENPTELTQTYTGVRIGKTKHRKNE